MSEEAQLQQQLRVVCTECHFSQVENKDDGEPAMVIIEHGKETGHTLTTEEVTAT